MSAEKLTQLIAPPAEPCETSTPKNWEKIEKRLGLQLPPDYKIFVNAYGTGSFDDFIIVYNPFAQNEYLNPFYALDTLHQANQETQLLADSTWTAVHPFELYPATEGLFPWGCTTNLGEIFFWQVKGLPTSWETIFYNLRNGEYEVWKSSMSEFLYHLFTRQIESVLLPENYPPPHRTIEFIPA